MAEIWCGLIVYDVIPYTIGGSFYVKLRRRLVVIGFQVCPKKPHWTDMPAIEKDGPELALGNAHESRMCI